MGYIKFSTLLITFLILLHNTASAVEFGECSKFLNTDKHRYLQCAEYSFSEATQKGEHQKAIQWLRSNRGESRQVYNKLLTILMCGNETSEGSRPFQGNQQQIIRLTDDLLRLGASFNAMPSSYIVTPLFCISNRRDSVVLNHVLTRIKASRKDLDSCPYEGIDPTRVPLFRAVINNDLASAKVLIRHGATPDFSIMENETALKTALELRNVRIANWLLDKGASVHKRDDQKGCAGKSALDYAMEIPAHVKGRDQIVARIKTLSSLPSTFRNQCTGS